MTAGDLSAAGRANVQALERAGGPGSVDRLMNARLAVQSDDSEAARFAVNLLARIAPQFDVVGPNAEALAIEARTFTPDSSVLVGVLGVSAYDALLRFGNASPIPAAWTRTVGSSGWRVLMGAEQNEGNVLAQLAAACFGVSALVGHLVGEELADHWVFSLLDFDEGDVDVDPRGVPLGTVTLVGLGGLGSGFLYAVRALGATRGPLRLIDFDQVDDSNLQRYVFNKVADIGRLKVDVAVERLAGLGLALAPYPMTFKEYFDAHPAAPGEVVVSALDHRSKRRELQGFIPERVVNASLGYENQLSVTGFGDGGACLYCLYFPDELDDAQDAAQAAAVGLSLEQLRSMRQTGEPVTLAMCRARANSLDLAVTGLDHLVGSPVDTFYRELCAGQNLPATSELRGDEVWVPLPFQAALGGILLASETVKLVDPRLAGRQLKNFFVWRNFRQPRSAMRYHKAPHPRCPLCGRPEFRAVYGRRFGFVPADTGVLPRGLDSRSVSVGVNPDSRQ